MPGCLFRILALLLTLSVPGAMPPARVPAQSAAPAPPGRLVNVGGHRLHLLCTGEGSPVVILEAGLGGFSIDWGLVQPAVAAKTRVCSYDRAGYAWSDRGPEPRGLHTSVSELHRLLAAAGVKPPYVLTGQSWGGRIVRLYAHLYPHDVSAVVLIDTYSEGTAGVPPPVWAGVDLRAWEEQDPAARLPAPLRAAREWAARKPRQQDVSDHEEPAAAMESTTAASKTPLGDKPLIVISAGRLSWDARDRASGKAYAAELRAHVESEAFLAGLSRNSRFLVARASFHQAHLYEPDLVAGAIVQALESARTGTRLTNAR